METMEMYIVWNFAMDLLVCMAAARACGREQNRTCLLAAGIGTAYALAKRLGAPGNAALTALCGAVMAGISVRPDSAAMAGKAIAAMTAASLFCAGAQLLIAQSAGGTAAKAAAACAGAGLCIWHSRARGRRLRTWDVQLFLRTDSGCARFRALVDTGNRLHEPISGLPVMIVEERALRRCLPEGFDAREAAKRAPQGWRLVAYGVLGGAGRMACFRPERLLVCDTGRWLLAPDIWVAVYPGRIPGQVAALAPTVLGTIEPAKKNGRAMEKRRAGGF